MVKLVYTLALGASGAIRVGSSPAFGTMSNPIVWVTTRDENAGAMSIRTDGEAVTSPEGVPLGPERATARKRRGRVPPSAHVLG